MKELTINEIKSVNGGVLPLLIFFAGEAVYGYSIYQTLKWMGEK
jgi:lactobin A/cerein 7B family class IIb bacteriocin